jgi:hypothetical protein
MFSRMTNLVSLAGLTCLLSLSALACASSSDDGAETEGQVSASKAREGEVCGTGFFGTPKIDCADGLVCEYPASTAPTGPNGSSSALPGKCGKPRAAEGEVCGNGFFGTPDIDCAEGLVCKFPPSTAPTGPNGSSSALPGACAKE